MPPPETIMRFSIGGLILMITLIAWFRMVPKEHRVSLVPLLVIAGYFILSGLIDVLGLH